MAQTSIAELKFYPGNARRGDIDLIAGSLSKLGQYKPIVANADGTILAGNHTVMAAQRLGWETIDVHRVDVDDETAKRIVLVDNASNDKSTYDVEELVNLLTDLPNLDATGFTRDEVDDLLETLEALDDEDIPEPPKDPQPEGHNLLVECENAEEQQRIKSRLLAEGITVSEV
ncbi:ParB/RepB/Spo0J family partition protein [Corynebacterium kefirresidentii]|uniref:ParB/RepB/Spo0J family partition protein n=1 Tax=Corynebacterium sp. CTNIH14 TaxID=3230065 RepID=UPI0029347717|nr:ParB/RepB/Spo0J family partition protein [Corynebacterium kefirresidentii]MDV2415935.1 ParB/RepB/Spo0J family partition protein [Corynebacterium kefirresidentii]